MNKLIAATLLSIIIVFSLTACSSRAPIDIETVKTACEENGLTIDEENSKGLIGAEGTSIVNIVIAKNDSSSVQSIIFGDENAARSAYANISASLSTPGVETVKKIDSATYSKLYVKSGVSFAGAVRIQNTLFYGEDNGSGEIEKILASLGY